jgi:hypothetical protein
MQHYARGYMWQCTQQCAAVYTAMCGSSVCGRVRLSGRVRGSVRLPSGAAVCGSAATRRSVLCHIRAVDA